MKEKDTYTASCWVPVFGIHLPGLGLQPRVPEKGHIQRARKISRSPRRPWATVNSADPELLRVQTVGSGARSKFCKAGWGERICLGGKQLGSRSDQHVFGPGAH